MSKTGVKTSLCALVIIMLFTSNTVAVSDDTGNCDQDTHCETKDSIVSGFLIDTEILGVPNMLFHFAPYSDLVVGMSNVRGFFLAINGLSTVSLFMHFHKRAPLGLIAFDLLCTHIDVKVIDMNENIVNQRNITGPSDFLFYNNWDGFVTLSRPLPLPGQFFYIIVIEIYGNYQYS